MARPPGRSGQHTGRTDILLTERGERDAQELTARLRGITFAHVLTSPLQRARRTGESAGFGAYAEADADLMEWDYGAYDVGFQQEGTLVFQNLSPLTCPPASEHTSDLQTSA